jgi:hypothetical protein
MAWADAIVLGGDSFVNVPSSINNGAGCGVTTSCGSLGLGPYWDNISGDGTALNVGNFLTGTGGFTGNLNYNPYQYLSQNNGVGTADAPTAISLFHDSNSLVLTLLATYTLDNSITFGYYDASQTTTPAAALTEHAIYGPGSLTPDVGVSDPLNIPSGGNYGFYFTRCLVYTNGTNSTCLQYTTWFSNDTLDTSDIGQQHFVIFDSQTAGIFYVGIEDWLNNTGEGYGDYNDVVFELNTQTSTPEPATLGLFGVGLFGIGLTRFRARKTPASS